MTLNRIYISLALLSPLCAAFMSAESLTVSQGQCADLIKKGGFAASEIVLKGKIDARDLAAFEKIPSEVRTLDLSEVSLEPITLSDRSCFGRTYFKAGEIPAYTFFKTEVETIILPRDVKEIGTGAFAASSLRSVVIPEGVEKIGDYAFYNAPNLNSVTLPSSLTTIGKGAFSNCPALVSINLESTKITSVPERLMAGDSSIKEVVLPATVTTIGREAFSDTGVQVIDLRNVKEFKPFALSGMRRLVNVSFNPEAKMSDGVLMDNVSLETLTGAPSAVPDYFAANCASLDSQDLLSNATSVGAYALANQPVTNSVIFGSDLRLIDKGAFSGMRLEEIDARALDTAVPEVSMESIVGMDPSSIVLYVTDAGYDNFNADPVWHLFQIKSPNHSNTVGLEGVSTGALDIYFAGKVIYIKSEEPIENVTVFTLDGRSVYKASNAGTSLEIPVDMIGTDIAVVTAVAGDKKRNVKLILK